MTKPLSVVAIVGSLHAPSRTAALVEAILTTLAETLADTRATDQRVDRRIAQPGDQLGAPRTGEPADQGDRPAIEAHVIQISEIGPDFAGTLVRSELPAHVRAELNRIEHADLLIAASPVYRASFTGLFKHLFDFVDQYALVDTPVLLAASGGSERHSLMLEHQMRPLFGFFQALTLPLGIYAHDSDFTDYRVSNPLLVDRIANAVRRGLPLIRSTQDERALQAAAGGRP